MALDVAQNKHAGKQFTEVGCHEQIVSWLEVVFGCFWKGQKGRAELDAQLQGELDTETLKTTRRLSAPFPSSFLYCNKPLIIFETSLRHSRTLYDLIWPKPALMTNR